MTTSWVTIDESPVVSTINSVLDELSDITELDTNPINPAKYVHWETIPLANIETLFTLLGIPSGEFLGEHFQRRAYRDLFRILQYRNYRLSLDTFAKDAQISYILEFLYIEGQKVGLEICITTPPIEIDLTNYLVNVIEWVKWILEWWTYSLTIRACQTTLLDPILTIGSIVHRIYPLTIFSSE